MKIVILDPGHGGLDHGAVHNGVVESNYVFTRAEAVQALMAERGVRCCLTRDATHDPSFVERAGVASLSGALGTVVLHVNAGDPRAHGPLAFYREDDARGLAAAEKFIESISRGGVYQVDQHTTKTMRWQVHAVKPNNWTSRAWRCIIQHPLPVVLLELEYCTHVPSARYLLNETAWIDRAICDCVETLLGL